MANPVKILAFTGMVLTSAQSFAQQRTEYHPNGNKKFEGEYFTAWIADEREVERDLQFLSNDRMSYRTTKRSANAYGTLLPVRVYNGKCIFYFEDGKKSYEGSYKAGVRHGKFIYWKKDGSKLAERSYIHGMADGKWVSYFPDGAPFVVANYKPFAETVLDSVSNAFESDGIGDIERSMAALNLEGRIKMPQLHEYRDQLRSYEDDIEHKLALFNVRTGWEGEFVVYNPENKAKKLEAFFKGNRKHGNWKYFNDEGKLALEMKFENDNLVYAKDYKPGSVQSKALKGEPVEEPIPQDVFKYVQQMPEAPYDVTKYFNDNLRYPEGPGADDGARVIVQFVVNEDGKISDPKIVGHCPAIFREEAIRLVKNMPKWKPGKQNGRSVKVYFTLPIIFKK
jgi:TonB family protein